MRIARKTYPDAYRTGGTGDSGVDVLSDLELPPKRAWQCKARQKVDWDDCRESLRSAMAHDEPPPHYTFVFRRPLTGAQSTFWRTKFVPQQRALYPNLETLDLWDDLAEKLDEHPEIVDLLSEGALAASYRRVAEAANRTGVNPLASVEDLIGDAPKLARRAVEIGKTDPHYRYENRQREARPSDLSTPEDVVRFGFTSTGDKPREFTATIRQGAEVQEKAAEAREEAVLERVSFHFAETDEGAARRAHIRAELAAGRELDLLCDADVSLDARPIPDRFRSMADADGVLRQGEVHIGLSQPLALEISMETEAGWTGPEQLMLYRIPSEPGASVSYGGWFKGALLFVDIDPDAPHPEGEASKWAQTSVSVGLDVGGVSARELLSGLGFALVFGTAKRMRLVCDGLLPTGGLKIETEQDGLDEEGAAILREVALIASALRALDEFDGRERRLSELRDPADPIVAELVLALLEHGEIHQPLSEPYAYSVPGAAADADLTELLAGAQTPLRSLSDNPTVIAELRIEGEVDGELLQIDGKSVVRATPRDGEEAKAVLRLVGPVPDAS